MKEAVKKIIENMERRQNEDYCLNSEEGAESWPIVYAWCDDHGQYKARLRPNKSCTRCPACWAARIGVSQGPLVTYFWLGALEDTERRKGQPGYQ